MFLKKGWKQAVLATLCLAAALTVFIKLPVSVEAAEVGKTIINSVEIDTDLFAITRMCGPAYQISEVYNEACALTGPKEEDGKPYYVQPKIFYRDRFALIGEDSVDFHDCSNNSGTMSQETLKYFEKYTYKPELHHCTAYYMVYRVVADTKSGFYFDPKKKPTLSFKGYSGTGDFQYVNWGYCGSYTVTCDEKNMWIAAEISLNTNQAPRITGIEITKNATTTKVGAGYTMQFDAEVHGYKVDTGVEWRIEGQESVNTTIDQNGLLTVGMDEKCDKIKVIATSKADPTITVSKSIAVLPKPDSITRIVLSSDVELTTGGEHKIYEVVKKPGEQVKAGVTIWGLLSGGKEDIISWDEFTVKPYFEGTVLEELYSPKSANTKADTDSRQFWINLDKDEPVGHLWYKVASKYYPDKYVTLIVHVGEPRRIIYDANGGSFGKNLNKTVRQGDSIKLADYRDVIPPAGKVFKCWSIAGVEYKSEEVITVGNYDLSIRAVYIDDPFVEQPKSVSLGCDNSGETSDGLKISFRFNAPGEIQKVYQAWINSNNTVHFDVEEKYHLTVTGNLFTIEVPTDEYWMWLGNDVIEVQVNDVWYSSAVFGVETESGKHVHNKWFRMDDEKCYSYCSVCGKDRVEQAHEWGEGHIVKYPTATESGEVIYTCTHCGAQKKVNYTGCFTSQPKNIYNKNDLEENNGFTVSEVMTSWSIERKEDDIFSMFDVKEESCAANTYIEFSCGSTGDVWRTGEYRIKATLENGGIIYSEPFTVVDAIESVGVSDLNMPVAGETFDFEATIQAEPKRYSELIEKTTINWFKSSANSRPEAKESKAVNGTSYYCEIILTPAEGYGFEANEDGSYAMEVFSEWPLMKTRVDSNGMLYITYKPYVAMETAVLYNITGNITSAGAAEDKITIQLYKQGSEALQSEAILAGSATSYTLSNILAGTYTLKATQNGCVSVEKTVTVDSRDVKVDVELKKAVTKLATPVITKLENASTGVKATWDAVEGAEMYRLMYKEPGGNFVTGGYTTGTSYTVKNLTSGVEYFFTVRCMTADKKTNTSDYDRVGTPITYIAAPVLQKVENAANGVKVTWDLSAGAELYKVMYKEPGGSYKTAGYTTENNYTVTGLTAGVEYTFTVRCMTADKKTYTSSYNSKGLTIVYQPAAAKLDTPKITKLENASTGVKATWDAVEGAEMYRLMYKEPGGSFVTGGYTTGTSYTVKNLTSGVTYAFTVRCMSADKKTNTSDYDRVGTPITYIAAPALKSVENTANGVKVTWDLSAGAELYKVMYKEAGGSYKTAGYTAENNYTVTGLTAGTEYTFTARCIMADKKTYTSSYDSKGLTLVYQPVVPKLATPVITKLENTASGVKVTWGAVEGAEMYRLMYKEPDGTFKTGGYTTGTSYTVKDVTGGVTYAFTVRCMTADKKTNTSDYDRVGTSITYIAPPVLTKVYNTASGVKVTWQASAGAELYKVMYMEEGGTWKTGGYSTSTGYTVKNLTEGTAYAFTVRCMTADKSAYTSGYDKTGLNITYVKP